MTDRCHSVPDRDTPIDTWDLTPLPVTHQARIPSSYLDEMGHMNVMWYTHLFDRAVYGVCELIGLDLAYMRTRNAGSFALESHIRYLSEVRANDQVTLFTRVVGLSEKRYHLMVFMKNETKGDLASTFEMVGAYIDMNNRRMAPIPAEITKRLESLLQSHQELNWNAPTCGTMKP